MNEAEAVNILLQELKGLGYPDESIRFEFVVNSSSGQRNYIDVAIIDPDTNDVVAIIEVKNGVKGNALSSAARQVASYAKLLPSSPLSLVYVFEGDAKQIGIVNESDGGVTLIQSLPSFNSLLTGGRAQNKVEAKSKSSRITDRFSIVCYLLACLVAAILALDITGTYKFSSQQLTLLGIFIGLLVIPFAAKFKLLGMEFERYSDGKSKNT
ncbi:type I restriction enzyme HsdR N-terminal domain-containing protein [Saccharophagus degradans]|uniref:Type I restriction enzyme HsdR N-terminal domain-containing protein n=1 Tax=Saccharophagus degradans TaxID=86304 RepID=A0AAW7X046_9GAMM|nr:type I restriction enzyme HsdR N-terminal domain-containing protein [Saccharophagus degradans]MDO6420857.1 type I restriction enzyme HsdR N-terminal domain-containing protein [Saccharophagus degradans]MDO6609706.1 type I restriction enzyme HsdR N-terminal domain-containing protein [Saccharophagus degradans]